MRAGQLRHLMQIERDVSNSTDIDSRGQTSEDWQTQVAQAWGSISRLRGQEAVFVRQIHATATHEIRMRWHPEIRTRDRIRFRDRLFGIHEVENVDERNRELRLIVGEDVST